MLVLAASLLLGQIHSIAVPCPRLDPHISADEFDELIAEADKNNGETDNPQIAHEFCTVLGAVCAPDNIHCGLIYT